MPPVLQRGVHADRTLGYPKRGSSLNRVSNRSTWNRRITHSEDPQELFAQPNRQAGKAFLKRWYFWATYSRLQPVIQAAKAIKRHWEGVLNWLGSRLTLGFLEGINSLVQAAKAKTRGYRTTRNLIAMAYLLAGKLDFDLLTRNSEEPFPPTILGVLCALCGRSVKSPSTRR